MNGFADGVRTMVGLELRQRVRGVAWYVLLGVFFVILLIVTVLTTMSSSFSSNSSALVYSVVTYVVLLMVTLVSPALSGGSINSDRDAATLAPVQVTLLSTAQIVWGKFFAAWFTGLTFLVVAAPFMIFAAILGSRRSAVALRYATYASTSELTDSASPGAGALTVLCSLAVLVVEVGVIAAIGVGLSGIISRPVLSVVTTYLAVAALSLGTLMAFGLGGTAFSSTATSTVRDVVWDDATGNPTTDPPTCTEWSTSEYQAPRFDRVWGILSANPYVILADATPLRFNGMGEPTDLFTQISYAVRSVQKAPELTRSFDNCQNDNGYRVEFYPTPEEQVAGTVPSWFVGLGIQLVLALGTMWWAIARTRTPARRLPKGTRIA